MVRYRHFGLLIPLPAITSAIHRRQPSKDLFTLKQKTNSSNALNCSRGCLSRIYWATRKSVCSSTPADSTANKRPSTKRGPVHRSAHLCRSAHQRPKGPRRRVGLRHSIRLGHFDGRDSIRRHPADSHRSEVCPEDERSFGAVA
jgi:hypothetical protein